MAASLNDLTQRLVEALDECRDTSQIVIAIGDALPSKQDAEREAAAVEQAAVDATIARYTEIRRVYDQLFDPAHYASIEGDGGREDAYCDDVWGRAEAIVTNSRLEVRLSETA